MATLPSRQSRGFSDPPRAREAGPPRTVGAAKNYLPSVK